jgi:hypothetical protein
VLVGSTTSNYQKSSHRQSRMPSTSFWVWVDQHALHSQLRTMHTIYNLATVTIVAAAGSDTTSGLPGVSGATLHQPIISIDGRLWVTSSKDCRGLVKTSKWATRAWTYQEGVFSRRRLTFTNEQVLFQCNASSYLYESPQVDPHQRVIGDSANSLNLFSGQQASKSMCRITAYSQRLLTHQSDVVYGLQGVFGFLRSHYSFENH